MINSGSEKNVRGMWMATSPKDRFTQEYKSVLFPSGSEEETFPWMFVTIPHSNAAPEFWFLQLNFSGLIWIFRPSR
jgi:hypothetical protein